VAEHEPSESEIEGIAFCWSCGVGADEANLNTQSSGGPARDRQRLGVGVDTGDPSRWARHPSHVE
jgi:hypothetical protein